MESVIALAFTRRAHRLDGFSNDAVDSDTGCRSSRKFTHLQTRQVEQIGNQLRLGQRIAANRLSGFDYKLMLGVFVPAQDLGVT